MKKFFLTFGILLSIAFMKAQVVSIPDINFKLKLLSASPSNQIAKDLNGNWCAIDTNNDNLIQQSEANNISYLFIAYNNYTSLIGINNFNNLKVLKLTSINVDNLNISNLAYLEEIECLNGQINDSFIFSNLINLKKISLHLSGYSYNSNLNLNLNFNNFPLLEDINVDTIGYPSITNNNIDFTNSPNIKNLRLRFYDSLNLDLSNLEYLETIYLNSLNLISLNLNGCTQLKSIYFALGEISANTLDFSNLPNLIDFLLYSNTGNFLNNIYFFNNLNLKNIAIYQSAYTNNNINLTSLDFSNLINLESLYLTPPPDPNASYNYIHSTSIQNLNLTNCISLKNLSIFNSPISSIDLMDCSNLNRLYLSNNLLTTLNLSNCTLLERLECQDNQLTSLDLSSCGNLQSVNCDNNNLNYLSFKNNTNESKSFLNNPSLTYICADDTEQWDVQLIVNLYEMWDTCVVGDYCSFNPNGNYNTISGNALYDNENDGCDIDDETFEFLRINMTDGTNSGSTFTNFNGDYVFYGNAGTFTLTPQLENPTYFNVSPETAEFTFTDNLNNTASQNFCITPNGIKPDVEVVLAPTVPARPGFDAHYRLVYKNKGNQTLSGSVVLTFDDTRLDFVSSSITPTSNTTGLLSWDYVNLLPFENKTIDIVLNVNSPMETPAVNIGDVLPFTATINPISGDVMPDDNVFNFNQIVVGAYDPNDITCLQGEEVSPDYIGEYLHYLIRFENTGNFAAENVVIEYFVNEEQYDLNTLQILNASHDLYTRINNNRVEFIFENIQLEPSDDSGGGHGGIIIKMKTLNNLNIGDLVAKQANIYFDYNFPIETNEAETTFNTLSAGANLNPDSFSVYPNPINDVLNIKTNSDMEKVELYDIQGRLLQTHINKTLETSIKIDRYQTGTYFVKIYTSTGVGVQKVMKK